MIRNRSEVTQETVVALPDHNAPSSSVWWRTICARLRVVVLLDTIHKKPALSLLKASSLETSPPFSSFICNITYIGIPEPVNLLLLVFKQARHNDSSLHRKWILMITTLTLEIREWQCSISQIIYLCRKKLFPSSETNIDHWHSVSIIDDGYARAANGIGQMSLLRCPGFLRN